MNAQEGSVAQHANINLATGTSRRTFSFQIATLIKVQRMVFAKTVHAIAIQISLDHNVSWQHVKNAKTLNDVRMSVVMPAHVIRANANATRAVVALIAPLFFLPLVASKPSVH